VSRLLYAFLFISIPILALGQNLNVSLNQDFYVPFERSIIKSNQIIHHGFKPLNQRSISNLEINETVLSISRKEDRSYVARKLFFEHFLFVDSSKFQLIVDPIVNFEYGQDIEDQRDVNLYKNTRGFNVKANIGNRFSFESTFRENQANLPSYLSERVEATQVAYGQGRVKTFNEEGFDFSMASAYLSFSPSERVNIQAGHGKHFVGFGHRSTLLSDLSFNYPFLKVESNWLANKLQYQNLYTLFQDLDRLPSSINSEALFERKRGSFHYLEYKPNTKLSIGLFEGLIWPSLDSTGNINVNANYWIPIIYVNTLLENEQNAGNNIVGLNAAYQLISNILLYGQLSMADMETDNLSFQFGAKYFIGDRWMIQGEYNNSENNLKSNLYTHYNESLSLPYIKGEEFFGKIQYRLNRWISNASMNRIESGSTEIRFVDVKQSYLINPAYNLTISLGLQYREEQMENSKIGNQTSRENVYIYFGISTNLQNLYFNY